ncbi:MAG: histidine kinase, partial [Rhodanobacteraceae bacterium]
MQAIIFPYDPVMHANSAHGLPSFWLIWLAGLMPIAFGVALAVSVASDLRRALLDHSLFLVGYMVSTIPLSLAYRSLWKRSMPWTKSVPSMLVLSLLIALAVTAVLLVLQSHLGRASYPFSWRVVLVSFQAVWFALLGFGAMLMVIGYYVSMQNERERATAATAMARDAELRALRYQLHPHFLFNTLNAISTLVVEERTRDATRMIRAGALHAAFALLACAMCAASFAAAPPSHGAATATQGAAKRAMMAPMHDDDARPWMNPNLSPNQRAELVLKAMTQDEKFRLLRTEYG